MIEQAWVAVEASAVNGAQTLLAGKNVLEVNRVSIGLYAIHLKDDLGPAVDSIAVFPSVNGGDATHRFMRYGVVSRREIRVSIEDDAAAGLDEDFSVFMLSDSDVDPVATS